MVARVAAVCAVLLGLTGCEPDAVEYWDPTCDLDGDGFEAARCGGTDCDDDDPELQRWQAWYPDYDGDGYGSADRGDLLCGQPSPLHVTLPGDCDDRDATRVLYGDFYADQDGDGFGGGEPLRACHAPSGHVADGQDCDDADPTVFPGGVEGCGDGVDGDCDGLVDCEDLACECAIE